MIRPAPNAPEPILDPLTRRALPRPGRIAGLAAVAVGLFLWCAPAQAISTKALLTVTGTPGLGQSVCTVDLNGDGYPDLVVGAPLVQNGAVYIYFRGSDGLKPDVTLTGESGSQFGASVASAGDVNGDGYPDLIVGASDAYGNTGRAYVFYGGPSLVSKSAVVADVILTGEPSSAFGTSVSGAGDVNGDGRADIIVGAPNYGALFTGRAYVFYGGPTLLSKGAGSADVIITGEANGNNFAQSVSSAGDVNGDGRSDIIIGAPHYSATTGRAYAFYGGPTLISESAANADVIITGEVTGDAFGWAVSSAGDLNGDGRSDIIIGAPQNATTTGRAYVFLGGATFVSKGAAAADVILSGEANGNSFGYAVSTAGDVNGDGKQDLIVGAPYSKPAQGTGRAYLFLAGPSLASKGAGNADIILTGDVYVYGFGTAVSAAGDMDGDGYGDVVVGAPNSSGGVGRAYVTSVFPFKLLSPNGGDRWTAGQSEKVHWLGHDVADVSLSVDGGASWDPLLSSVGGQADNTISVTAPAQTSLAALIRVSYTGQTVTHGTSVRSAKVFTIVNPAAPVAEGLRWSFSGVSANDQAGNVVSLGDVNGDGYPDYIVGAPGVNANSGAAYIFFGGPKPHAIPDVTLTGEPGSAFGASAAPAGDVNGDGYPDVIVGAPNYTAGGRVYIFFGGPRLGSKGAASADVIVTGEAGGSLFGSAVSGGGDLNGDGRADIIVGDPSYGAGIGRAYIFYGGPTLVSKGAGGADVILSGENGGDFFGCSVSSAGDVNGDGWFDAVVGAKGYKGTGRAYVFYGGPTLATKGAGSADGILTGEGPPHPTGFGTFVSGVGDINGDARCDIAVSDVGYNGKTGRCYVFFGGSTLLTKGAESADVILTGETGPGNFGTLGAAAGDVNGDGYPDLIVGAPGANSGTGRAYVFYGGPALASKGAAGADLILNGENAGSPSQFGVSVCWAGDVRRDGFADLLVGSSGYNGNRGRAYLYDLNRYQILSPAGGQTWTVGTTQNVSWLGAAPADLWISENGGDSYDLLKSGVGGAASNAIAVTLPQTSTRLARVKLTPADATISGSAESDSPFTIAAAAAPVADRLRWTFTGGSANDRASNVTTLGDINGDGYPDFLVGAPGANANAGAAYIFYGGPAPHASPDVTLTGETGSAFGASAAPAGDLNGDGYPDVIVGAPNYPAGGRAYVFFGGPRLGSKGAGSADVILTGEAGGNLFGSAISGGGDLNGDGRADIIVGAPSAAGSGRAYVFYGGATLVSKGAGSADVILSGENGGDFWLLSNFRAERAWGRNVLVRAGLQREALPAFGWPDLLSDPAGGTVPSGCGGPMEDRSWTTRRCMPSCSA